MATFDEVMQKELIETRKERDSYKEQLANCSSEDSYIEEELEELQDYVNSRICIKPEYFDTINVFAKKQFQEQLEILANLIESEERFNASTFDELRQTQREVVFNLASILAISDNLETSIPFVYRNLFKDEIEQNFTLPDIYDS